MRKLGDDFKTIDAHAHMGSSPLYFGTLTIDDVVRQLDENSVDAALVMPLGIAPPLCHDVVAEGARKYPGRIFGMTNINPLEMGLDKATAELERCVKDLDFVCYKIMQSGWRLAAHQKPAEAMIKKAEELAIAVMCCTGSANIARPHFVGVAAGRHPDTNFIIAHMGSTDDPLDAIATAAEHDNVYLEISTCSPHDLWDAINTVGVDKILYGTDLEGVPYAGAWHLYMVRKLGLPPSQERLILGENAKRVLKLDI
jgi:predicted TIM-barrel fold metal-dependent hydrolase